MTSQCSSSVLDNNDEVLNDSDSSEDDDDDDNEDDGDVDDEAKDEDSKKHDVDQVQNAWFSLNEAPPRFNEWRRESWW